MTLRQSWLAVVRGWRVIAVLTVVGLVAGLVLGLVSDRTYISNARLFVAAAAEAEDADELFYRNQVAGQRIASYVEIATGDAVTAEALKVLGDHQYDEDSEPSVSATTIPGTVLIDLQATAGSAEDAQALAAAYAEALPEVIQKVETLEAGNQAVPVALTVVDEASPGSPSNPGPVRNLLLGGLLGLVLGAVFCVLRAAVRGPRDDERSGAV